MNLDFFENLSGSNQKLESDKDVDKIWIVIGSFNEKVHMYFNENKRLKICRSRNCAKWIANKSEFKQTVILYLIITQELHYTQNLSFKVAGNHVQDISIQKNHF